MFTHMEPDTIAASEAEPGTEVMAAVEDGPVQQFVIADISRDDAYLTLPLEDAASLPAWR
jgi:hypothetical protein